MWKLVIYIYTLYINILGTIQKDQKNKQVLDKLQVERERGITVKAQVKNLYGVILNSNLN